MNVLQRTWSELVPDVPEDGFAGRNVGMVAALESLLSCDPRCDEECFAASSFPVSGAALSNVGNDCNERVDL